MCFFITVVGSETDARTLRERFSPSEIHLAPQQNPNLLAPTGGEALWILTSGGCSCDLFNARQPKERKVGKKGWSKAKIQRAIEQAKSSSRAKQRAFTGLRHDVRMALSSAAPIGFFVHWYSGDVRTETFSLGLPVTITSAELATGSLAINVDRWYRLVIAPNS